MEKMLRDGAILTGIRAEPCMSDEELADFLRPFTPVSLTTEDVRDYRTKMATRRKGKAKK